MSDLIKQAGEGLRCHAKHRQPTANLLTALIKRVTELERQRVESDSKLRILRQKLSRYRSGVEVEGLVEDDAVNGTPCGCLELLKLPVELIGQRVRALVLPEERIVDANKTMKEVE